MTQDELKRAAAEAALEFVGDGSIVGVGTGSTANFFIDGLARMKDRIRGAVASSEASAHRLASLIRNFERPLRADLDEAISEFLLAWAP